MQEEYIKTSRYWHLKNRRIIKHDYEFALQLITWKHENRIEKICIVENKNDTECIEALSLHELFSGKFITVLLASTRVVRKFEDNYSNVYIYI